MSNLTENQRGQIIGLHKSGVSYRSISKTLGFPTTTVFRTVKNFKERCSVTNLPRIIVKRNNHKSAEQIKDNFNRETCLQVSIDTIRRILHEINIFSRVPA